MNYYCSSWEERNRKIHPDQQSITSIQTGRSTEPVTQKVTVYSDTQQIENRDIELKVVDIPGLGTERQSNDERHDIMAQLIVKTNKEADIFLY